MTISHGGYSFESISSHGVLVPGPWLYEDAEGNFFAVIGSSEVTDRVKSRILRLDASFTGYDSQALLQVAMRTLDSKINVLRDATLTIASTTFEHCTFKGFEIAEPAFLDGSGVNGWIQQGALVWKQLQPNA